MFSLRRLALSLRYFFLPLPSVNLFSVSSLLFFLAGVALLLLRSLTFLKVVMCSPSVSTGWYLDVMDPSISSTSASNWS